MISDAERRRLDEIERLMRLEDPAFAQRFDQLPPTPRTVACTAILVAVAIVVPPAVTAIAVAIGGSVAAVLTLCVMTTVSVGVVLWRHRARPSRRWP